MNPLDRIAEARITEAIEKGVFDDLPGRGKPLALEDLSRLQPELRAGYLLLADTAYLPEEMELEKGLLRLDDLIAACADDEEAAQLDERRTKLALRFEILMERRRLTTAHGEYRGKILRRLGG